MSLIRMLRWAQTRFAVVSQANYPNFDSLVCRLKGSGPDSRKA